MTVPAELEVEIRRLYYAEHWPLGTIARQNAVHEDVVRRVLGLLPCRTSVQAEPRPSIVAPYTTFIDETLDRYPTLRATRVYDMIRSRGYTGSVRTLREYIAAVRPASKKEAFVRTDPLIGEQAQVDWAHVGRLAVEGGARALWVFVIVLAWSRAMWAELVFDTTVYSLLRSLVRAARFFGGSSRQWLFDNPKTVVLERVGTAVRFHPLLLELSGAYCAELRVCAPRKANQKGRVERVIRFLRERFFAGRTISSIERGNEELLRFIHDIAHTRPHPDILARTVQSCFDEERGRLLPLPEHEPVTDLVTPISADKLAFVRFDKNAYSVPHTYSESTVTLAADDRLVRLLDSHDEIARHKRCWGVRQRIERPDHRRAILEEKRGARDSSGRQRLRAAAPKIDVLFERWVDSGRNVGSMIAQTLRLLDLYGASLLAEAVEELVGRGTHDPGALGVICDQRRRARSKPVPIDIQLADHVPERDVIPHDLEKYDG